MLARRVRVTGVLVTLLSLMTAAHADAKRCKEEHARTRLYIVVEHDPVVLDVVKAGPAERQIGDLRILPLTPLRDSQSHAVVGRLDATLLTTAVHHPAWGDEVRMSTLNFVFGEGNGQLSGSADQILVSGSGYYPGTGSTISPGTTLYRPVTGGSGRYMGATGQARTEHLGDGSWRHSLELWLPSPRCR